MRARLRRLWSRLPPGALVLSALALVDLGLGFAREGVTAYYFGASRELDAFLVAYTLPRILAMQSVHITVSLILPLYIAELEAGRRAEATALLRRWWLLLLKLGLVFCVVIAVASEGVIYLIAPGLEGDLRGQAADWLRWLLPYVLLVALAGVFKVVLNSHQRFAVPALSGDLISLAGIVACLVGAASLGVSALIPGFFAGAALAFALQWAQTRAHEPRLLSLAALPAAVKLPLVGAGILVVNAFAVQANLIIDRAFASSLPEGSIAALNYANSINLAPSNILATALATALFPILARLVAQGRWGEALRTTVAWAAVVMAVGLVAAGLLVLFRTELVELMFQRGAFDEQATRMTSDVLLILPLTIPISGAQHLVTRLLLSQRQLRAILAVVLVSVVVKIAANAVLVPLWGLSGIVIATVVAGVVSMLLRFLLAWRGSMDRSTL